MQPRRADFPRRDFLIRSCQGISASLLRGFGFPVLPVAAQTRLQPHYRDETPLHAAMQRLDASSDDFPCEKEHDRIAPILARWSAALLESPRNVDAVAAALADGFRGTSMRPVESLIVRPGPALEERRVTYAPRIDLEAGPFVRTLREDLGSYSKILTVEFQITRLALDAGGVTTRVRYEFVGNGAGFHREQRAGFWELEWTSDTRIRRWRAAEETRSRSAAPWFADVTAHAFGGNISYSRQLQHGVDYWRTVLDGACGIDIYGHNGISVGDIDGDGWDDVYICQPAGLPNRLYRNRGDGTFEDVTDGSGVGILENTACALIADFDNDGRQDLVVVRANGPLLFLNQGGGKFRHIPGAFRFASPPQGTFTGAAAADYDRDGWLDIYFCLYAYYQGTDQYKYPVPYYAAENGPPNFMMRNNRDRTFTDVTASTGLHVNNTRYSFCCGWCDYNRDGWPDLYVVNDFGRKNLYRNNGDGAFTDVAAQMGVEDVGAGMSTCWLDYDNDGATDLYVGNMWTAAGERISMQADFQKAASQDTRRFYRKHAMGNSLYRQFGGSFEDVTAAARVGMGRWAWSSDAWDFDHDGFPDLYIANGMLSGPVRDDLNSYFWRRVVAQSPQGAKASPDYEEGWNAINELIRSDYTWSGYERNVFYANNRDGTFSDVSGAVGLDFVEDGRAFALADFDGDGRLEALLKNRNAPQVRLLKIVAAELPPSIAFRLRGVKSNRDAIGATITVGRQTKAVQAGSGFLSQHSKELMFGLGEAKGVVDATIRWPSGEVQPLHGLPVQHRIWVEEGVPPSRMEPFRNNGTVSGGLEPAGESLPDTVETWLLSPVAAPSSAFGKPVLVTISDESNDLAPVYNIIYRYLFDRHRDMLLPTSFLIDEKSQIVKVYQGRVAPAKVEADKGKIPRGVAERLAAALPFPGAAGTYEFGRNNLTFGSVFFERGYLAQAEAAFRLVLRDDPSSGEAYYGLGSVYLKQEKTREARDCFERAVKLHASYPDTLPNAWNNLGLLATREGRMDEAIANFEQALRVSPDYWIALENLGNAYRQQERWDQARQTLERALAARPNDAAANYNLAMVFAQTDDAERADRYLRRALELRPAYPEALNNMGILYLRTGRRDQAVAEFEQCIRVAPEFDQSYLNLARVYRIEGSNGKARAMLQELLKQHPDHAQAQNALRQLP
jgi:tetratricopeptide (TPR) repeat protein